ncbi:MAG: MATE family efflux transporter [Lachnospiraceae bacterium]|nr:MATE family efflux transporter [Lachnospiraceae bacterium]MBR3508660.1 MATE family efflux transporter [Lachnospiraceae bacterium]MBR6150602.1 MATE family efflux transporter [Lachnospiraceae bacterium]
MEKTDKQLIKETINIAWPAVVESFFIAFVGLVDSYMVSGLGSNAVAAIGLTTQPKFLGLSMFFAINVSLSALVARRRGENRKEEANRILVSGVLLILIAAVIISTALVAFAGDVIRLCGSNSDTHELATVYFKIVMGGMIFNCIQMGINSAQRGAGNTKITMRTNLASNTVNVIFNYLLIGGKFGFPAMGVRGAALATVLGTVVACAMSILSLFQKGCFVSIPFILKNKILPSLSAFQALFRVGYSIFFEQILMRVGFMATSIMAAKMGTAAMAAHQVGMNIMGLSFSFGDGLQATAVALIGRSLGERNHELAKAYGRTCRKLGMVISLVLAFVYFFGGRAIMSAFFDEPEIVAIGVDITRIIIAVVIFQISQVIYMGCLRGAGDTGYTALASIVSVTVIRTVFSYVCGYALGFGINGVWMGILADQVSRFIFGSVRFKQGRWTDIRI